jgi:hypothetical protein
MDIYKLKVLEKYHWTYSSIESLYNKLFEGEVYGQTITELEVKFARLVYDMYVKDGNSMNGMHGKFSMMAKHTLQKLAEEGLVLTKNDEPCNGTNIKELVKTSAQSVEFFFGSRLSIESVHMRKKIFANVFHAIRKNYTNIGLQREYGAGDFKIKCEQYGIEFKVIRSVYPRILAFDNANSAKRKLLVSEGFEDFSYDDFITKKCLEGPADDFFYNKT